MREAAVPAEIDAFELPLGEHEYERLRRIVQAEAGIHLGPAKQALVAGRLGRRLRELGLGSFREYCALVERDPSERVELLDRISTNETRFFREPHHFELLARQVLPRWQAEADQGRRPRSIRAWSAACSTGEEPYTLAMVLLGAFPPGTGWELSILASDLSTRVLRRAQEATWPAKRAEDIPPTDLRQFMLRGVGPRHGEIRAGPELRALVRHARINLTQELPPLGSMDLVFCRNVLIYFDAPTKQAVLTRLIEHLAPDGYLFLGHAESLAGASLPLRSISPSVYQHTSRRRPRAGAP
jgi:chemotaxis protein methyltransferase CheR